MGELIDTKNSLAAWSIAANDQIRGAKLSWQVASDYSRGSSSSIADKLAPRIESLVLPMVSALISGLGQQLRRLALLGVATLLCFGLAACDSGQSRKTPTISDVDMALIERQAEGFLAARNRLPELAELVNERNWVFTANLIHGPMQEVGREMSYINQRLLPADRPEANKLAQNLKTAMAQLDEATKLQDGDKLRKAYIQVASGFGRYAQVLPDQVQADLKQA